MAGLLCPCRVAAQEALETFPGGMQLGGSVTPDNAASWLDAGASHVIATSFLFQSGELQQDRLQQLVRVHPLLQWAPYRWWQHALKL